MISGFGRHLFFFLFFGRHLGTTGTPWSVVMPFFEDLLTSNNNNNNNSNDNNINNNNNKIIIKY